MDDRNRDRGRRDDRRRDAPDEPAWQAVRLPGDPAGKVAAGARERLDAMLSEREKARAAEPAEDFGKLLEEGGFAKGFVRLEPGEKISGRVVSLEGKTVLVDVGQRSEGWIPKEEFKAEELERLRPGDTLEAYVVRAGGAPRLARAMGMRSLDLDALIEAARTGVPVEGKVSGENKGGFQVDLPGLRGFVPFSQMDAGLRPPPSEHIGKTYRFRVLEVRGKDVVLSRAALLREEQAAQRAEVLAKLEEGQVLRVAVVKVETFGLFVDVGAGLHALVPRSEVSWGRSDEARSGIQAGDQVTVKVIRVERGGEKPRVTVSIREAGDDPWALVPERFPVGTTARGRVTRLAQFGAFVELSPGIEGLLHVSEMSATRHVRTPGEVARQGDELTVSVTAVDTAARRISLSMKVLEVAADEPDPDTKARFMAPQRGSTQAAASQKGGGETAFAIALRRMQEKQGKR